MNSLISNTVPAFGRQVAFHKHFVSAALIAARVPWAAALGGCRDLVFVQC